MKTAMLKKQKNRCRLCRILISEDDACLDHDHVTGLVREVLCRNCNGIEGKVFNLARRAKRDGTPAWWIKRLLEYWEQHEKEPSDVFHPTHRTVDEKRILRNKRARKKRAAKRK